MEGESVNDKVYDGEQQIALFPGKLPNNIDDLIQQELPESNNTIAVSESKDTSKVHYNMYNFGHQKSIKTLMVMGSQFHIFGLIKP